MTLKVKVFFTFLAVSAILSVFSFFDIFHGVRSANLHDAAQPLPLPIEEDVDQDGLSNSDESQWNTDFQNPDTDGDGFLDGEEVASGNDPREASTHPLGDSLSDTVYGTAGPIDLDSINITDDVSSLMAGAITTGDITRSATPEKREQSIVALSHSALNSFYKTQSALALPEPNLVESSKENQEKYLESLSEIIKENLIGGPAIIISADFTAQAPYFAERKIKLENSFNKTSSLPVPKNWLDIHNRILDILDRYRVSSKSIVSYEEDIVKAMLAYNEWGALNDETRSILEAVQENIKTNDLSPDDNVFKVMDIIHSY